MIHPGLWKCQGDLETKTKQKQKSLAEVKQLIKLFVCVPSFIVRTKLGTSGIIELNCLASVEKFTEVEL